MTRMSGHYQPPHLYRENVADEPRPISILIVEDNRADIQLFEDIFDEYRISNSFEWAGNGEEALELIERQRPDLILLDTILPGMTSFEVLAKIKSTSEYSKIAVVMVTGSFGQVDHLREQAPNADGYMTKPITLEGLAAMVSQIDSFAIAVVRY
jgi:CheY-like chemotaxis protein